MRKFLPFAALILGSITLTSAGAQEQPPAAAAETSAPQAKPLSAADKAAAIDLLAQRLSAKYIFADVGDKMATAIRGHLRSGDYDKAATHAEFAEMVTADIQAVNPDKHLRIRYVANGAKPDRPRPSFKQGMPADFRQRMTEVGKYWNFEFEKVERLPGNIMYVKFDAFFDADIGKAAATAAMNFAASGNAMIIDLRENGGGDPRMVAHVASYLLGDKKVHLSDIVFRADKETNTFWSNPAVPGARFGADKPVYVLTSSKTFSAAEDFTYNLQAIKRITVVGETSKGGAHPIQPFRIDPYLVAVIPVGRSINPITKGNWEGTGVKPDVAISADKALAKANALALRQVLPQIDDPEDRPILEKKLAELEASL
ncbi:S41 family peptidase [Pseudoduganella violaceinigra]|uniref:S41 family peptidase n=1 Tax=Pseudoduganella violaceinigra TaxID=246602 RepID=UPI001377D187|nr:S41 family peptidase [Pseudoduganella violaceinigra]